MRALLIGTVLFSSLLCAQEIFLPQKWIDSEGTESIEHAYCQNIPSRTDPFCEKSSLAYSVFTYAPDPVVARQIARILRPKIEKERKVDHKKNVLDLLGEFKDDPPYGEWYSNESIDLFSLTPKTFTLRSTVSTYSGGAHGSYTLSYTNYLRGDKSNTPLTFDDLLIHGYQKQFTKIAESYYKECVGLKPSQSLEEDGWFDNRFVLPSQIAVTPRGLRFHYNAYEIKAYAYGHTDFLLPYAMFRDLIKPGSVIADYSQPSKVTTAYFTTSLGDLYLKVTRSDPHTLKIETAFKNTDSADTLWLSLSFPQLRNKKHVQQTRKSGFDALHIYPANIPLYHIGKKKSTRSRYLLIEAEKKKLKYNTLHTFSTSIKAPASLQYLRINLRTVLKYRQKLERMPDELEGITGQQGFKNYEISIPLR